MAWLCCSVLLATAYCSFANLIVAERATMDALGGIDQSRCDHRTRLRKTTKRNLALHIGGGNDAAQPSRICDHRTSTSASRRRPNP